MERLGRIANPNRERMHTLARRAMQAASKGDQFDVFVATLQEYVDLAVSCLRPFRVVGTTARRFKRGATAALELDRWRGAKQLGADRVWLCKTDPSARRIAAQLERHAMNDGWQIRVCSPARTGAKVEWIEDSNSTQS